MKTINSLSGGKTSSYMAFHYPADYNIFSLVRIEDVNCKPKDKSLIKYVSDKIGMDFIATAESDLTLKSVIDLEQLIGKDEICLFERCFHLSISNAGSSLTFPIFSTIGAISICLFSNFPCRYPSNQM